MKLHIYYQNEEEKYNKKINFPVRKFINFKKLQKKSFNWKVGRKKRKIPEHKYYFIFLRVFMGFFPFNFRNFDYINECL